MGLTISYHRPYHFCPGTYVIYVQWHVSVFFGHQKNSHGSFTHRSFLKSHGSAYKTPGMNRIYIHLRHLSVIYSSRRPNNMFFSVEGWEFCWHETTQQSVWQKKIDKLRVRPSIHPPIGSDFKKKMDPMFHHGQEDTKKNTSQVVPPPSDQRSAGDL